MKNAVRQSARKHAVILEPSQIQAM